MSQRLFQGRTNNHLTWVMVDATDFATPESALSAAMTIKIYGKTQGATGVNFVSSGTGSLTNDIQHVGASATGVYTIALAKADLSDASAAWYDQYTVILAGTGAAQQVLVCEGVLSGGNVSNISATLSDVYSLLSDTRSTMDSQFLVVSNYLSNASNYLSSISAISSDAYSAAVVAQALSASDISDLRSAIAAVTATVSASDISDIASAVWAAKYTANSAASSFGSLMSDIYSRAVLIQSAASDAASAAAQGNSRVLLVQSRLSDLDSRLVSDVSDIMSNIDAVAVSITASDISDIASAVAAAVGAAVASQVWATKYTGHSAASSFGSLMSDIYSRTVLIQSAASDAASAAQQGSSRTLLVQSRLSDLDSRLVSEFSDIYSLLSDTRSTMDSQFAVISNYLSNASNYLSSISALTSDAYSAAVVAQSISASDMSDIRSAIAGVTVTVGASDISDIASAVWANTIGARVDSRVALVNSSTSDIYSLLSDVSSDVGVISGIISDLTSVLLTVGIKKNTALSSFEFFMVDSADHVTGKTGLTITGEVSIDGAAFAPLTNSATEVANGIYKINLAAADLNGTVCTLKFTSAGADARMITIKTHP